MASGPAKKVIQLKDMSVFFSSDMSLLPIGKVAVLSLGERSRSFIRFAREEAEQHQMTTVEAGDDIEKNEAPKDMFGCTHIHTCDGVDWVNSNTHRVRWIRVHSNKA